MNFGISFAPLVPETIVWVALAIACVLAAMLVFANARGKWMRIVAMTLFVLALGNPSITREDRDPLTSVAVVVIDKSPSQEFGDRPRPTDAAALGFAAPVHALITGRANERDRRVVLVTTPRFGIVGQSQTISYRVEDQGASTGTAQITVRRDGETIDTRSVRVGHQVNVSVQIPHPGANIVEIEASPLENELTTVNNRAVVSIDGVRDKLRVLLVSGEPHAGERTWRNLLKSDASVDLVHFTILRPPEQQDGTPINELSLIAFPTRALFQQKINEFQLIISDGYARQGVLPIIYFDNIARYVQEGGAVLVAAGPDYASPTSIWRTPLEQILPAEPSGRTIESPFRPRPADTEHG